MPRKRKRYQITPPSILGAKSRRRSFGQEGPISYCKEALCARCSEVEFLQVLPSLDSKKNLAPEVSSKVLQRLVFDSSEPSPESCTSCELLDRRRREPVRLRASRVYEIGMGVTESRKRYSNSCFAIWPENEVARYMDKYRQEYFTRSGAMLGGMQRGMETNYYDFSEIYIPLGSNLQAGTARKMSAQPNYTVIKAWLDHCSRNHSKCQHLQSDALKLISLIDVDRRCLVPYPSNKEGQCNYIALSYVWGDTKIEVEKHGEIPDRLPQTIHDSIEVVRQLGKKYLWVDSICIDQSDPAEKMAQIRIMDTIYEGAFATIIALSGTSADDCLPGVGSPGKRTQQIYAEFGENLVIQKLPDLGSQVSESVWANRAWTYQEGLLSRRCLFFTELQVYFVCNQMDCCESLNDRIGVDPLTPGTDFTTQIPPFIRDPLIRLSVLQTERQNLELLVDLINGYTRRHLSRDDDSLNAISALLQHMQQVLFLDGFLCGLPLANFRKSLLWHQNSGGGFSERRNVSSIPSWSWAGWKLGDDISFPSVQPWIGLTYPPLKITSHGGKEIDIDKATGGVRHYQVRQAELEHSERNQQKVSATLAFYNRLEAQTICDLTAALEPRSITSNPCALLVEGILLKFPLKFGGSPRTSLQNAEIVWPDGLDGGAVYFYRWLDASSHKLSGRKSEDMYQDFLLVSTIGDKYSKLRLELLYLFWEGGVAFRGGVVGIDIDPGKVKKFWDKCNTTWCRFWLG